MNAPAWYRLGCVHHRPHYKILLISPCVFYGDEYSIEYAVKWNMDGQISGMETIFVNIFWDPFEIIDIGALFGIEHSLSPCLEPKYLRNRNPCNHRPNMEQSWGTCCRYLPSIEASICIRSLKGRLWLSDAISNSVDLSISEFIKQIRALRL
jgi:hypothetical protein